MMFFNDRAAPARPGLILTPAGAARQRALRRANPRPLGGATALLVPPPRKRY